MSFLPEDDQQFLEAKGITFEPLAERAPNGEERLAILIPGFVFNGDLRTIADRELIRCDSCDLLILIPSGYSTTKLDSFYTIPRLKRPSGEDPSQATREQELFARKWQFWSRHLSDGEWRIGQDGLETYLQYVRAELGRA